MGIFSQIWKFLLESQDYTGSLDNFHKFRESLKIDAWKAFVTWSAYPILWSFWLENHSILPSVFSSPRNFPSHLAACIAHVASPLHNSFHYKHSQLHSKMQPFKFLALKFWLCLPFLDYSCPLGCWIGPWPWPSRIQTLTRPTWCFCAGAEGRIGGEVIQILFSWIVY